MAKKFYQQPAFLLTAAGLLVTSVGSGMMSQRNPAGRTVQVAGMLVMLASLSIFVISRLLQRRARLARHWTPGRASASFIVVSARVAAVSLMLVGVATFFAVLSLFGGFRWSFVTTIYALASGGTTGAMGLALWLLADILVRVDESYYARRERETRRQLERGNSAHGGESE